jgi:tetratricopeptide (TPR) repeat protein
MEKVPWKINEVIDFMLPLRFDASEVAQILPDLPEAWYKVGRRMEKDDRLDQAELFYRRAIEIAGEGEAEPDSFNRLYRLYQRQQDQEKALEILRLGIRYLPDHAPFRIQIGDYYLQQGIQYRAVQEYTQALRVDPDNIYVRRKLETIEQN